MKKTLGNLQNSLFSKRDKEALLPETQYAHVLPKQDYTLIRALIRFYMGFVWLLVGQLWKKQMLLTYSGN